MTGMETREAGYREGKAFGDRHLTKAKENKGTSGSLKWEMTAQKKWSQEGSDERLRLEKREEREEAMTKHRRPF